MVDLKGSADYAHRFENQYILARKENSTVQPWSILKLLLWMPPFPLNFNLRHCADIVCIFSFSIDLSSDGPLWPQTFRVNNIYWTTVMRLENKNVLRQSQDLLFSLFCIFCSRHFIFRLLMTVFVCWKQNKMVYFALLFEMKYPKSIYFYSFFFFFSFSLCSLFQICLKWILEIL